MELLNFEFKLWVLLIQVDLNNKEISSFLISVLDNFDLAQKTL